MLADMLLEAGDARGEYLRLQLERSRGPLKGLARGRFLQLEVDAARLLVPGTLVVEEHRYGIPVKGSVVLSAQTEPEDPAWATLRSLAFSGEPRWDRSPLAGRTASRLEVVFDATVAALDLLGRGPPRPRLRELLRVRLETAAGLRDALKALAAVAPALRHLEFEYDFGVEPGDEVLDALRGHGLAQVTARLRAADFWAFWTLASRGRWDFRLRSLCEDDRGQRTLEARLVEGRLELHGPWHDARWLASGRPRLPELVVVG